jgi:hypothetical protein
MSAVRAGLVHESKRVNNRTVVSVTMWKLLTVRRLHFRAWKLAHAVCMLKPQRTQSAAAASLASVTASASGSGHVLNQDVDDPVLALGCTWHRSPTWHWQGCRLQAATCCICCLLVSCGLLLLHMRAPAAAAGCGAELGACAQAVAAALRPEVCQRKQAQCHAEVYMVHGACGCWNTLISSSAVLPLSLCCHCNKDTDAQQTRR